MASAFWTLEDGRGFARRWTGMAYMLQLITDELRDIEGADEFHNFLGKLVFREENGDEPNGFGGFLRGNKNIMFNFDLRTFAPQNREYFWQAAQKALTRLKIRNDEQSEGIEYLLTTLLDMHKRVKKGEDPLLLTHTTIQPILIEKVGPGW
jgi:hypothetical protein